MCIGAHKIGAIIKRDRENAIRRVPDVIRVPALGGSRTNLRAARIGAGGIDGISSRIGRHRNVWDLAGRYGRVQSIDPLLGQTSQVGAGVWETRGPLWAADCRIRDTISGVASRLPLE